MRVLQMSTSRFPLLNVGPTSTVWQSRLVGPLEIWLSITNIWIKVRKHQIQTWLSVASTFNHRRNTNIFKRRRVLELPSFCLPLQVFKGEEGVFQISGLQGNTDYRFRVGACRRCQDTCQELCGPLSPSSLFTLRRQETASSGELCAMETGKGAGLISSDERFAALIVCVFAGFSILIACLLQYFFMKWGNFKL